MPVAVVLATGILAVIACLWIYTAQHQQQNWLQPLLESIFLEKHTRFNRALWRALKLAASAIPGVELLKFVYHYVATTITNAVAFIVPKGARIVHSFTAVEDLLADAVGSVATETLAALTLLRNVTIPRLLSAALAPVRVLAQQALQIAQAAQTTLNHVDVRVGSIVRSLPWGVGTGAEGALQGLAGATAHLWRDYFDNLKPNVGFISQVWLPSIQDYVTSIYDDLYTTGRDSLAAIRASLRAIEQDLAFLRSDPLAWLLALLGSAAGIVGLTALLAKVAPWLFCRNTTNVAKRLCAMDSALLDALLAGALLELAALNVRQIAHLAQDLERGIEDVVRATAEV